MFVGLATLCFFLGYLVRIYRCWTVVRPLRTSILGVAVTLVFSAVITLFTTMPTLGELSKWIFLGVGFSASLFPAFWALVYMRMFDFFVLGIIFSIFGYGAPLLFPCIAVSFVMAVFLFCLLRFATKPLSKASAFLLNRWHYLDSVKVVARFIDIETNLARFKLLNAKKIMFVFLYSSLIWICEGFGFFFLLSKLNYPDIRLGVVQGLLNNILQLSSFFNSKGNGVAVVIQQIRYESFDIPLFLFALVIAGLAIRQWVYPKQSKKHA